MTLTETQLETQFVEKLLGLKYTHRPDIRDRATLERNFREKFEAPKSSKPSRPTRRG